MSNRKLMEEILDKIEKPKKTGIYSKIAFGFTLLSFLSLVIWITYIPATVKANEFYEPPLSHALILLFSVILGFVFSLLSIRQRERNSWIKGISIVLNIGLFLIVFGSILFSIIWMFNNNIAT